MKPFHKILKIKQTHFVDGWAKFDETTYYELSQACGMGCSIKTEQGSYLRAINILFEYPDLMCFGKASEEGVIVIEGITGFPSDDICVRFLNHAFEKATRKRIGRDYIFIEF